MAEHLIAEVATIRLPSRPNLLWVEVRTTDGTVGLGETFFMAAAVESYVHEIAAPYLIGRPALQLPLHWRSLYRQWQRRGIGIEARGASAIDIALWDLFGRLTQQPLYQLLGGKSRDEICVYNTCAGPDYVRNAIVPGDPLYGTMIEGRPYEDLRDTHADPVGLAESLLEQGISAMKVFPFDVVADETGGERISLAGLKRGIRPLEAIRGAVGGRIEIALELRARWSLPAAKAIARATADLELMWIEDPIRNDNVGALTDFAEVSKAPVALGENLGSRHAYRDMLEASAVEIVINDPCWCGGVTEARRVADMAAMYMRPYIPHDCTGPVGLATGLHLACNAETGTMQEIVRAFYLGWYPELVDGLPPLGDGRLAPLSAPGHGLELCERRDFVRRVSNETRLSGSDNRVFL
jgi:galactonate dehydratase